MKKKAFTFSLLPLILLFLLTAMTGENRPDLLAELGVQACVPRPFIDPPPLMDIESVESAPLPCPDGFVPQPIERWVPGDRPAFTAQGAHGSAGSGATALAPASSAKYFYAGAYQWTSSPGSSAFFTQHLPWLMPTDHHTLAEMAVQSADTRQIVEVGWTVDRLINGDEDPRLFVYHWVNGIGSCYNGCGWVQTSTTRFPGMRLAYDGAASQYMIQYRDGNWWIGYQGEWIGYFPGSLWNGTFTRSGLIQWFGELAAAQDAAVPSSYIGNYYQGTSGDPNAARMDRIALFDDAGGLQPALISFHNSHSALYNSAFGSEPDGFSYGGHGAAP